MRLLLCKVLAQWLKKRTSGPTICARMNNALPRPQKSRSARALTTLGAVCSLSKLEPVRRERSYHPPFEIALMHSVASANIRDAHVGITCLMPLPFYTSLKVCASQSCRVSEAKEAPQEGWHADCEASSCSPATAFSCRVPGADFADMRGSARPTFCSPKGSGLR